MRRILLALALLLPLGAQAAITFIAGSMAQSSPVLSRTPTEPTGTAQDDLVLAFCSLDDNGNASGTWTAPGDFTQIDQFQVGVATFDHTVYLGYKIRGASEGSGYTFSNSGTAGALECSLTSWRGVNTSTPLDVTYVKATHYRETLNDAGATAAKAITTATNNAWVVLVEHWNNDNTYTAGAPSGYTLDYDNAAQANRNVVFAHKAIGTAGAETPGAWTHSNLSATVDSASFTLALKPAGSASCPAACAGGRTAQCITSTASNTDPDNILYGQSPAVVANEDTVCYDAVSDILSDAITITASGWPVFDSDGAILTDDFDYCIMDNGAACGTDGTYQVTQTPVLASATGTATGQTTADLSVIASQLEGTAYTVVVTKTSYDSFGAPSHAQISTGKDGNGAAATFAASDASVSAAQTFSATGLTAGTAYRACYGQANVATSPLTATVICSSEFTTTAAGDTTPDAFTLTDQVGIQPSAVSYSNAITVAGINAAANVSVSRLDGICEWQKDTGAGYGALTSGVGTVAVGNIVRLVMRASDHYDTSVSCTLTIGGVSDTWSLTTISLTGGFVRYLHDLVTPAARSTVQ